MKRKITGFHQDNEAHWVADLECGHRQHVRHDPPWMERPWVITPEGRESRIGAELECKRCDEAALFVGQAVQKACLEAAHHAYESGGMSGLCAEGRQDLALDAIRSLDLKDVVQKALAAMPL